MIHMVADSEPFPDQVSHAGAGPQIGGEACGFGSRQEGSLQLLLLEGRKLGRPPGHGPRLQGLGPTIPAGSFPSAHTTPTPSCSKTQPSADSCVQRRLWLAAT